MMNNPAGNLNVFQRLGSSLQRQGMGATLLKSAAILPDHWFDWRHGLDTCTASALDAFTITSENRQHGCRYQPTRLLPLRKFLRIFRPKFPAESVLVDFGCGKGRVLLVASEFGFREVRGIEFAHELCDIARKNFSIYQARRATGTTCQIIEMDVTQYAIRPEENVFFMFNPFDEVILERVLNNIASSVQQHRRNIWIIYCLPTGARLLDRRSDFLRQQDLCLWGHTFTIYTNRS
jgi:SAM-dependent methyltransferase